MRAFLWHHKNSKPKLIGFMQVYYFYRHPDEDYAFIRKEPSDLYILDYIWVDCLRQDVVGQVESWQEKNSGINSFTDQ